MIVCPVCKENNEDDKINCIKCNTDLIPLIRLREQFKLHFNRGLDLAKKGNLYEAIQSLLLSASLNPSNAQAYIVLGKIFAQRLDFEAATHYLTLAQKIAPNNPKIYSYLEKISQLENLHRKTEENKIIRIIKKRRFFISLNSIILMVFTIVFLKNSFFNNDPAKKEKLVKQALIENPKTTSLNVDLDPNLKSLNLKGSVNFEWQKILASAIAKAIAPELQIDTRLIKIDRLPLCFAIKNAIKADNELAKESIRIIYQDSMIQLQGIISNSLLRKRVEQLVYKNLGINFYDNSNLKELPSNYLYLIRKGDTGVKLAQMFYGNPYQLEKIKKANISILNDDYDWPINEIIIVPGPVKINKNFSQNKE